MPTPIERAVTMASISPGVRSGVELARTGGKFQSRQQQRIGKLKGKRAAIEKGGIESAFESLAEQQKAFERQQEKEKQATLLALALTAGTLGFAGPIAGVLGIGAGTFRAAAPLISQTLASLVTGGQVDPIVGALGSVGRAGIESAAQRRSILDILAPVVPFAGQQELGPGPNIARRERLRKELF